MAIVRLLGPVVLGRWVGSLHDASAILPCRPFLGRFKKPEMTSDMRAVVNREPVLDRRFVGDGEFQRSGLAAGRTSRRQMSE